MEVVGATEAKGGRKGVMLASDYWYSVFVSFLFFFVVILLPSNVASE